MNKQSGRTLILLYLVLALYSLLTLAPFLWMLLTSFKTPGDVFKLPPGLVPTQLFTEEPFGNYTEVWTTQNFFLFFRNSAFVSFSAAIGQVFTTALSGYAFARLDLPGKNWLFALVLATSFVTIIPEFLIMRNLGWIDTFLPLIVPSFLVGAFGTFLLREYFGSLPDDYADAAHADGASPFQIFYRIYLPLAQPALIAIFVIAFINNWDELLRPLLFLNSEHLRTVPLILIYALTQRYVLQGFVGGGVKG